MQQKLFRLIVGKRLLNTSKIHQVKNNMRKIITTTFVTMDGVMQAPGGPEEDTSNGFKYGGWQANYQDDVTSMAINEYMSLPFELLLGRRTYDIFAPYWSNA